MESGASTNQERKVKVIQGIFVQVLSKVGSSCLLLKSQ